ncbi:MAG: hypothetical protein II743_07810 [Lachnospiraceae bacterium]|nr:hypothetical protein [Lachnospiraceae bacterium]
MKKRLLLIAFTLLLSGCANPIDALTQGDDDTQIEDSRSSSSRKEKEIHYDEYFLENSSLFGLNSLSNTQQIWYGDIENILSSMAEEGPLNEQAISMGLTEDDIDKIFACVCIDHPEFFYVEGYSYSIHTIGDKVVGYSFAGKYTMTREEAERRKKEIETAADEILRGYDSAESDGSDYSKIKYLYEALIKNTEYDLSAPDNQTIYSALVGKKSVCQGYAKSMQYLLTKLGIECTLVQGIAQGQAHGWNLVKSNGQYYHLDATWGDNSYHPADGGASPEILYDYMLVTTAEIKKDHIIEEIFPLPVCTATQDNYFEREGAVFSDIDEIRLKLLFASASPADNYQVSIKCTTKSCFDDMKEFLLDQNKIFDYYTAGGTRISYYQNEELLCLTFWVTN